MAVRVVEERHPEVVILHWRDEVRLAGESDPTPLKFANSEADVRTAEVDLRRGDLDETPASIRMRTPMGVVRREGEARP